MLMSFFINPSMMNSMDFCCNSFATMSVMETHQWLQLIGNYVTTHIDIRYYLCVIRMYLIANGNLNNYYVGSSIDKQSLLMSFEIRCLVKGSNVVVW
jgi:hypothetical protein